MASSRRADKSRECFMCKAALKGRGVLAMGRVYHTDHFRCAKCEKTIRAYYQEADDQPYCVDCYQKTFPPTCAGCAQAIVDASCVSAMENKWHPGCFACSDCKKPFIEGDGVYLSEDKQPLDLQCYLQLPEVDETQ